MVSFQSPKFVSAQETDTRTGSFTTPRGTAVSIETILEHEAIGETPVLKTFIEYSLSVEVTLDALSNDSVRDIHDIEFFFDMTTNSLIPNIDEKEVFSAYYFDSSTSLTEDGTLKSYDFTIFVSGNLFDDDTTEQPSTLNMLLKVTEDVDNGPDNTHEFEDIKYNINLQPGPENPAINYSGNYSETRHITEYTDESTNIEIDIVFNHDGEIDGKLQMKSYQYYQLSVNVTLVELGNDPRDIHDLEIEVVMVNDSNTDNLPENDEVNYFKSYSSANTELIDENTKLFNFVILPNTNLNATEVRQDIKVNFKEDLSLSNDPSSEFDTTLEIKLN